MHEYYHCYGKYSHSAVTDIAAETADIQPHNPGITRVIHPGEQNAGLGIILPEPEISSRSPISKAPLPQLLVALAACPSPPPSIFTLS